MKYQADLIKKLGHVFVDAIEHKAFSDSLTYPGHCSLFSRLQNIRMNHAQAAFQTTFNHQNTRQIIMLLCWIQSQIAKSYMSTAGHKTLETSASTKALFYKERKLHKQ